MKYQVSVIVATYNSRFDEIISTIRSILYQDNVLFEIIISDDGSTNNYFKEIENFFKSVSYHNYRLIKNKNNIGTVSNVYNAISESNGEYIKLISPGDYLYNKDVLFDWLKYMKDTNIDVSFGYASYYNYRDGYFQLDKNRNFQPILKNIYSLSNYRLDNILILNIVLSDCILGAAYLCKRELLVEYLQKINNKIRLCEDFAYRIMLLEQVKIIYYDNPVIYYNCGSGVTSNNSSAKMILRDDEIAFDNIVISIGTDLNIVKKIQEFLKSKKQNNFYNRIKSFLYFPKALFYRVKMFVIRKRKLSGTCKKIDEEFLQSIGVNFIKEF